MDYLPQDDIDNISDIKNLVLNENNVDLIFDKTKNMIELFDKILNSDTLKYCLNNITSIPENIDIENLKFLLNKYKLNKINFYSKNRLRYENETYHLYESYNVSHTTKNFYDLVEHCKLYYPSLLL
jgi:hypothetical protein